MATDFSFDIVSKVDLQAVEDAVHTAMKEIGTRFDFKGSISKIEFDKKAALFTLTSEDELKLKSVLDVLHTRLAKRAVPLKNLEPGKLETALGGTVRQTLKIIQGIPSEKAKAMVAELKKSGLKVQPQIQADQLRVVSRSKDLLQQAMALLRAKEFGVDLQFTNYR